jgi:ribosome biogenesis GTPase
VSQRGGDAGRDDAVVLRVSGPTATIRRDDDESEVEARIAPRLPGGPPVAGDRVRLRAEGDETAIVAIAPRRTRLERADGPERRPRALVANAELLVVVAAAASPPPSPRLIDRYLVAAYVGRLEAAVVITKTDLPHDEAEIAALIGRLAAVGYPVLAGCARAGPLVGEVRDLIGGRVAILAGHSGVGKSTLTRGLTGVERATREVSRKAGTGRHTTSDPRLIPLPGGGAVVDTAGVRTFHLPRLDRAELEAAFPEIAEAGRECRFRGCAHDGDAGCAVPGRVSGERLESYRRMLHDMR